MDHEHDNGSGHDGDIEVADIPLPTSHHSNNSNSNSNSNSSNITTTNKITTTKPPNRTIELTERRFNVRTLPPDQQRVYGHLAREFGEEYGLLFLFTMRTAVELHRAWHMTLLTSNILQQVKDKFGLRMTWNLGVVRLKFRVEDGGYELHRKVPYDYDSEYQDIYYRIAVALIEGQITVHEALLYQSETKAGKHTAASGLFLRNAPGRLVLYPLLASTCAIIFFNGRWIDAGVAAICGLAAGLIEALLSYGGNRVANVLNDVLVGISTGIIGGLWYNYVNPCCLSAIFLGTLYWHFYGTAFVIGLLEIIAGELETGVTRFVAVSVKTFVLSIGASIGLMISSFYVDESTISIWVNSEDHCGVAGAQEGESSTFVDGKWWRIPMYLACCVGVLGQYRMPVNKYWVGMAVQLAAYELQYQVMQGIGELYTLDHLDTTMSNIVGAAGGVIAAYALSWVINTFKRLYCSRLLANYDNSDSKIGNCVYQLMRGIVKANACLRIGRKSDILKLGMENRLKDQQKELNDPHHPRQRISLEMEDESLFLETVVSSQNVNIWSILMPAVYQLVPGSVIAKLWFSAIFPPAPDSEQSSDSIFSNLMVISTSLALGLVFGFAVVGIFGFIIGRLAGCWYKDDNAHEKLARGKRERDMIEGMCTAGGDEDDPQSTRLTSSMAQDFSYNDPDNAAMAGGVRHRTGASA